MQDTYMSCRSDILRLSSFMPLILTRQISYSVCLLLDTNVNDIHPSIKTDLRANSKSFIMSSAFVPGSQQRYLRACMVCSIVQTHAVSTSRSTEIRSPYGIMPFFCAQLEAILKPAFRSASFAKAAPIASPS